MSNRRYDMNTEENVPQASPAEERLLQSYNKNADIIANTHLLYVTAAKFETDWHSTMHTHHFSELFYILGGRGKFRVNDKTINVRSDDLIMVNPNVSHTEVSLPESPLEYIVLGIQGFSFISPDGGSISYDTANYGADRGRLRLLLNTLFNEMQNSFPLKDIVCHDLLRIILVYILRHKNINISIVNNSNASKEAAQAKSYLDEHFNDNICLDDLADEVHLNKFYLVHNFTETYGLSPMNYLIQRRIEESKRLLTETDYSITQIAQFTGFSSGSYYSQRFRHSVGISPNVYRKRLNQVSVKE